MDEAGRDTSKGEGLGHSARMSLLWSGSFTILRDIAQFGTMLVLVRLLSPSDYGTAALDQAILGFVSVFSFGTFAVHVLQFRDPAEVDWQAHFTAATVVNTLLFFVTLLIAWGLSFNVRYENAALPLAGLSFVFLVEIPGTLRHRMLEVAHDWKRFRLLVLAGTLLALTTGLVVALLGGGVWALIVQIPLFGVPAAIDLFAGARWRPTWTWSWLRYRDTASFAANRMSAAVLARGRQTVESSVLAGTYDFSTLGVFARSLGLATILAGRIGSITVSSLYPVITRAECGSEQFRRFADLVFRGVVWVTVPATVFLAVTADDMVNLLYGAKWSSVIPLVPLAAGAVGVGGICMAANSLLLANNQIRACLMVDFASTALGIGLALWLVPTGLSFYLAALIGAGALMLSVTLAVLIATSGISFKAILIGLMPAAAATLAAVEAAYGVRKVFGTSDYNLARLLIDGVVFAAGYLLVLRIAFPGSLRELLEVAPGGAMIARGLFAR